MGVRVSRFSGDEVAGLWDCVMKFRFIRSYRSDDDFRHCAQIHPKLILMKLPDLLLSYKQLGTAFQGQGRVASFQLMISRQDRTEKSRSRANAIS